MASGIVGAAEADTVDQGPDQAGYPRDQRIAPRDNGHRGAAFNAGDDGVDHLVDSDHSQTLLIATP